MQNKSMTVDCLDNLHKQERKAVIYERTDTRPNARLTGCRRQQSQQRLQQGGNSLLGVQGGSSSRDQTATWQAAAPGLLLCRYTPPLHTTQLVIVKINSVPQKYDITALYYR